MPVKYLATTFKEFSRLDPFPLCKLVCKWVKSALGLGQLAEGDAFIFNHVMSLTPMTSLPFQRAARGQALISE